MVKNLLSAVYVGQVHESVYLKKGLGHQMD